MSLTEFLIDSAVGAVGGFVLGRTGIAEGQIEEAELVATIWPEELQKRAGVKPKIAVASVKGLRALVPMGFSAAYSAASVILNSNPEFTRERFGNSLPGAFLGYAVGASVRAIKNRKFRWQLKQLKKARDSDPNFLANINRYVLTDEEQRAIAEANEQIESRLEQGNEDPAIVLFAPNSPGRKIDSTIESNPRLIRPYLTRANGEELIRIGERAAVQRTIRRVFETPSHVAVGLFEGDLKSRLRVFLRKGQELVTQDLEYKNLRLTRDDVRRTEVVENPRPDITRQEVQPWKGTKEDYRTLSRRVIADSSRDRTLAFAKKDPNIPVQLYFMALANSYLDALGRGAEDESK